MDNSREIVRGFLAGILSMLWMLPCTQFWLAVWGPLRPYGYSEGSLGPSGALFLGAVFASVLPLLLGPAYFRTRKFELDGRLYEAVGVRQFRRFVPDGDLVNGWYRRATPEYRLVKGREQARQFLSRTETGERTHLMLLIFGIASSAYAWYLDWLGWTGILTIGNIAVNLYPILLQRYTRGRITRLVSRVPVASAARI